MRIAAFSFFAWLLLAGCAPRTESVVRIALLAPFEGADRDIGYEALYAARMALSEADDITVELLPIDDGVSQTAERARALAVDPLVKIVLLLGTDSASAEVQAAFGDLPVVIIGDWGAQAQTSGVIVLADERPPSDDFRQRYLAADQFAPEPGTLAMPVYDAASAALTAAHSGSRADVLIALTAHLG